ncbi:hypothetical protein QL285_046651 [Trifolium repens]|nr:hypothetical protein QL285_046651 [Trifolium repens]
MGSRLALPYTCDMVMLGLPYASLLGLGGSPDAFRAVRIISFLSFYFPSFPSKQKSTLLHVCFHLIINSFLFLHKVCLFYALLQFQFPFFFN